MPFGRLISYSFDRGKLHSFRGATGPRPIVPDYNDHVTPRPTWIALDAWSNEKEKWKG